MLLFARVLLYLISVVNFSLDPHINYRYRGCNLCCLRLNTPKGSDCMKEGLQEWATRCHGNFIYFNLVAFSAFTWYNLDSEENQAAVAYTSVIIMFILLLGVNIFHVLRYTRLYKCSFVEKAFIWMISRLLEKKLKEQSPKLITPPEELDGYRLERLAAGDQNLPIVTYSVVGLSQSQEDDMHHNNE